jgi:hypothetical protein
MLPVARLAVPAVLLAPILMRLAAVIVRFVVALVPAFVVFVLLVLVVAVALVLPVALPLLVALVLAPLLVALVADRPAMGVAGPRADEQFLGEDDVHDLVRAYRPGAAVRPTVRGVPAVNCIDRGPDQLLLHARSLRLR